LNRLISAQNAGTDCSVNVLGGKTKFWGNSYGYDAWGNLLQKTVTKCNAENLSLTALANNQLAGYGYDAAGNMTSDPTDGASLVYDAENRIATATKGGVTTTYTYDADGNRVKKANGSTGTFYWNMSPGIVAESDLNGVLQSEYVFFGGERVARKDFPAGVVSYYFSDHLKTASVITDSAGVIKAEADYYPWGGELQFVNNDSNHYKFTGKERDAETGLDYFGARYYSSGLGRWVSADWSATPVPVPYADFRDPQSLNLYTYVRNVPTTRFDADGHLILPQRGRAAEQEEREREEFEKEEREFAEFLERTNQRIIRDEQLEAQRLFIKNHPDGYDDAEGACHVRPPQAESATAVRAPEQRTTSIRAAGSARPHGNTAGTQPAQLYALYDKSGNFLKWGVSQAAAGRYDQPELKGGEAVVVTSGPRNEMLKMERWFTERAPGPQNNEPWRGTKTSPQALGQVKTILDLLDKARAGALGRPNQ
jgi:RHS repeat-associated protein